MLSVYKNNNGQVLKSFNFLDLTFQYPKIHLDLIIHNCVQTEVVTFCWFDGKYKICLFSTYYMNGLRNQEHF